MTSVRAGSSVRAASSQTALIVAVPEAEPAVAGHRDKLDRAAAWGVPAHVTVLYPFAPLSDVDAGLLSAVAGRVPRFEMTLRRLGWFDERVVWLDPEPAEPFRRLTTEIMSYFPAVQPYGGAHDEVIPHLTIGHDHPPAVLRAAGAAVLAHGPIHARVTSMRLITGPPDGGPWTTVSEFPFG
jgi:2'-5' RNA ligase